MDDQCYVLAVDFGSTKVVAAIFGVSSGAVVGRSQAPVPYLFPGPGRSEMDPEAVWELFVRVVRDALASARRGAAVSPAQVSCLGLSVQRNSVMLWERATGRPLSPFLTWRDARASRMASDLNNSLSHRLLRMVTKCLYFVARRPKHRLVSLLTFKPGMASVRLRYLLKDPEIREKARQGSICAGCLESWLIFRLTEGQHFATEVSCASVTGLYDVFSLQWSGILCGFLEIPLAVLPEVRTSDAYFGHTSEELFGAALPIRAVLGDQQAAMLGEEAMHRGETKCTLGTLTSIIANAGPHVHPSVGAVFPVALWQLQSDARPTFGMEGVNFDTGPALDWLTDVGLLRDHAEIDTLLPPDSLAAPLADADAEAALRQLCFVPSLSGIQLPVEDHRAGTLWIGIRSDTSRADLIRAVVLGIVFQTRMLLERFRDLTGLKVCALRCNGGVTRSARLMQALADVTNVSLEIAAVHNTSLLGVARLAGSAEGLWPEGKEAVRRETPTEVHPNGGSQKARLCWDKRFAWWRRACETAVDWHRFAFEGDADLRD